MNTISRRIGRSVVGVLLSVIGFSAGCGTGIYQDFADGVYAARHPVYVVDGAEPVGFSFDVGVFGAPVVVGAYDEGVYVDSPVFVDPFVVDDGYFFDAAAGEQFVDDGGGD
jgi:hypothetical protein